MFSPLPALPAAGLASRPFSTPGTPGPCWEPWLGLRGMRRASWWGRGCERQGFGEPHLGAGTAGPQEPGNSLGRGVRPETQVPGVQASRCGATPRGPSGDTGVSSSSQGRCKRGRRPIWTEHWEGPWEGGQAGLGLRSVYTQGGGALSHEDVWVWRSLAFGCCWNRVQGRLGGAVTRQLSEPACSCQCLGFQSPENLLEVTSSMPLPPAGAARSPEVSVPAGQQAGSAHPPPPCASCSSRHSGARELSCRAELWPVHLVQSLRPRSLPGPSHERPSQARLSL